MSTRDLTRVDRAAAIYLIFVCEKNESATLTAEQKRQLRQIATRIREQP